MPQNPSDQTTKMFSTEARHSLHSYLIFRTIDPVGDSFVRIMWTTAVSTVLHRLIWILWNRICALIRLFPRRILMNIIALDVVYHSAKAVSNKYKINEIENKRNEKFICTIKIEKKIQFEINDFVSINWQYACTGPQWNKVKKQLKLLLTNDCTFCKTGCGVIVSSCSITEQKI